ncbi:MAG: hypothetical protein JRJ85_07450 [Deltaproteobacteria bacterium]|nr:hypothetical protein [Deltaproteobacteria bacterium]
MIEINRLKKRLGHRTETLKVVSFDVFDTLLIRLVPTERVSRLSAENLSGWLHTEASLKVSPGKILRHRFAYQANAERTGLRSKWTLTEWLTDLAGRVHADDALIIKFGRRAELEAEFGCLRIARNAAESIELARRYGFLVIATSDMWLENAWLEDLLGRFDLSFDHVFSSGSLKASKRDGNLFKVIEARLGCPPESFLHVGDKWRADFLKARRAGWRAVRPPRRKHLQPKRLPPKLRKGPLARKSYEDILQTLDIPPDAGQGNPFYDMAFHYIAPLLIIFSLVQWRKFEAQAIDTVFYIARDARIMLDVYQILEHQLEGSCPLRYIRLSRRAVALAHPAHFLANALPLPGKVGRNNVAEWLSNFVIEKDLKEKILHRAGLEGNARFGMRERQSLKQACRSLHPEILEARTCQTGLIRDYLLQNAVRGRPLKRIGIVDSGWACTTQDILRGVFPEAELISGIYLGVSSQGYPPDHRHLKYGLLRDDFRRCRHHNAVEASAGVVRLWDTLLREPAGTVLELKRDKDGVVEPVLKDRYVIGENEIRAAESTRKGRGQSGD